MRRRWQSIQSAKTLSGRAMMQVDHCCLINSATASLCAREQTVLYPIAAQA
jgi:hypothetical protein